jgi:excinuclease UvrABC ATPase subunit
LKHQAKKGDLLMIDEPELNLHPKNQRRLARLLVKLVNIGLKVFITTHSDYILKEFNTLIMLKPQTPHLAKIAAEYGYSPYELLAPEDVKVYIAQEDKIRLPGSAKSISGHTLKEAKVDPDTGIEVPVFDETIDIMNAIQDEILYGLGESENA